MSSNLKRYKLFIGALIILICALIAISIYSHRRISRNSSTQNEEIVKWQDLDNHSVAVTLGSASDFILTRFLPHAEIMRMRTPSEVLAVVESGRAEFASIDKTDIRSTNLKERNLKIQFESYDLGGSVAFAFNKNQTKLCEQYNDFFDSIVNCKKYDSIEARWISNNIDTVEMPVFPKLSGKPIEVASFGSGVPYSFYKNGRWYGWEIEILMLFGQYVGRPIHISDYDFSALITAVAKGKADIAAGHLFISDERSRKVLFSKPYFFTPEVCICRINDTEKYANLSKSEWRAKFQSNLILENRWKMLVHGLEETLIISFWSLIFGTLIGMLLCFLRMHKDPVLRLIARGFNGFMHSVPVLVVLMIMFYIVLVDFPLTATQVAIFAFSLNTGSNLSEIFRHNINSVDKGQIEAGCALGLSNFKCFKKIVFPQALKKILPQYKNEINALIKNTSIVGYVAIQDLTKMGDIIRSRTFDAFFPLIMVSIVYIIIALILNLILDRLLSNS